MVLRLENYNLKKTAGILKIVLVKWYNLKNKYFKKF